LPFVCFSLLFGKLVVFCGGGLYKEHVGWTNATVSPVPIGAPALVPLFKTKELIVVAYGIYHIAFDPRCEIQLDVRMVMDEQRRRHKCTGGKY
jgi:hypothetical protein